VLRESLVGRALYFARDVRARALFAALRRYCRGRVLDVGGGTFVSTAIRKQIPFDAWTVLEADTDRIVEAGDARVRTVHGDGCEMAFADESFDTFVSVQVLEHVFDPMSMLREARRVLKLGGYGVMLIPQTSTTHLAPHFFCNFSGYWIERAMREAGLEIVEHHRLGGVWSTTASHSFYFFFQAFRTAGMSDPRIRRNVLFYLLFPAQAVWAVVNIGVSLLLSLGDLAEEPNNHLVVVRRPGRVGTPT
jgi:SAM-dependent methyltransferase